LEELYGFLVYITPILIVVILIQLSRLDKKISSLKGFKDQKLEILNNLHDQGILSKFEVDEKVKEYKREYEKQILSDLRNKGGVFSKEKYEQIINTLEVKQKNNDSTQLRTLREKLGDDDVVSLPELGDKSWKCVCGTVNHIKDNNCENCHRSKNFIFKQYNPKLNIK
jgi:hypothetical protein